MLIWAVVTFGVASFAIGWRNARIVNVQPALALFAALSIDQLLRWRASRALALGLVALVLYEAWMGQFILRAHRRRNATAELCTTLWSLPLPATVYVVGAGPKSDDVWQRCVMPPGSLQLVPVEGAEQIALNDSHTAAIVYTDRTDVAERLIADAVLNAPLRRRSVLVLLGDREEVGYSGRLGEVSDRGRGHRRGQPPH